jgi:nicotinamidase-related amidase
VAIPAAHSVDDIIARSASLATAFRRHGLPVVLVNVAGRAPGRTEAGTPATAPPPDWTELVAELQPQPTDHRVTKSRWGAFYGTDLDDYLKKLGITQIVLAGVATSMGVESTARAAHEHGYHVVLAVDAMTDRDAAAHQNSVERTFPKLGETAMSDDVIAMLDRTG